uniref:BZIP domain-containing protein n=1 Tax=Corethron hystrix TaxID=216773 RepID=A0A6U5M5K0_9STRA|mmetsp:Transcript_8622/g.18968  ORF Transcript_8622/g.18968 Transcript_8622/m.18968 type:complete len:196 (+) Transcript_8622:379-966(+)
MDSQHEHVRNTSDTSSDNNLTEVSVGSSTSLDLTNESIEKNQNATSNEKDGGTCSPSNNISSISRCERSEHAPKSDQNESTEQDLPPVGTKRKSNQRKLSHEERLQLNREAAKETRKRKKEELEELRRIIISNSRETQQFRRNNEVLVKENEDLKKQNLFLQEELLLLRTQVSIITFHFIGELFGILSLFFLRFQ